MKALSTSLCLMLLLAVSAVVVRAADIAVVMSSDAMIYQEALGGFRDTAQHRILSVQTLTHNQAYWRDELKRLRSITEPDLIFVIGTPALQAVSGEITNIPIVHTMVFNPAGIVPSHDKNIIGISMTPSTAQIVSLVREVNPRYRRIGTMTNFARVGPLLPRVRLDFEKAGLELIAKEIRSAADVGAALKSLSHEIDLLWLWPDETFLSDDLLQRIFLFSFNHKIPVLGLLERHTEMGALVSLSSGSSWDMGRQAGEAVNKLFASTNAAISSITAPRQIKLTVNLKTAQRLGVDIPRNIVQRADNGIKAPVYQEGDWWDFRIKTNFSSGPPKEEIHRVVFKNGKFDSADPAFLSGWDPSGPPSLLAFPSVYLVEPTRKWLEFPLLPGKTWTFTYVRRAYARDRPHTVKARAEVKGMSNKPVDTIAGKFDAIEISRVDPLIGMGAHLNYFYSPQTKSVIRSHAKTFGSTQHRYEYDLELVAYGTAPEAKAGR